MIHFFNQDIDFEISNSKIISNWIISTFQSENKNQEIELSIIFNSDEALLEVNQQFLNHDYYTDIITFTLEDTDDLLEAELYISIDRIKDNAALLKKSFEEELHRVIIHGVLHLCSYKDKTDDEAKIMRKKEDEYLKKLSL
ncbi:MAG: rRNA maturation RNase YbeY [Chitinophagales bacterium]